MPRTTSFTGIIPAVFTPLDRNGDLSLQTIPRLVEHLVNSGAKTIFALGSSGEAPSLTISERMKVAESYLSAAPGKMRVILHIGHNCLSEAKDLARHAAEAGADAISMVSPGYFLPDSIETLCDCLAEVASEAPSTPFFFYHLPGVTGVDFDTVDLTGNLVERIPSLTGIKFSKPDPAEFRTCLDHKPAHLDVLWGCDEMYLSALAIGAEGAVGTTFNYLFPLFQKITEEFEQQNMHSARKLQGTAVEIIRLILKHCGRSGFKAVTRFTNMDCGPSRLPLKNSTTAQLNALHSALERVGFFEWASISERGVLAE